MNELIKQANELFNSWADLGGSELPPDHIDAMQLELMRWQRRNFGDVSPIDKVDVHMGLGVIEEFGEALAAQLIDGSKGKLDGLGDVCVYAGQLLIANRLAIRPVMTMADQYVDQWFDADGGQDEYPVKLFSDFAHALLKHEQRIRGMADPEVWRPALCDHLAKIIGWTKLDCYLAWSEGLAPDHDQISLKCDGLIQTTYIDVGRGVVLKRDWTANPRDGINQ